MKRREFIALIAGAAVSFPLPILAQKSPARIGWLIYGDAAPGPIDQSLKDALDQIGIIDGRTVEIIHRYAKGDLTRLLTLAEELVALKPDLLLALGGDVIKVLFDASKGRIPVVGGVSDSPVRQDLPRLWPSRRKILPE